MINGAVEIPAYILSWPLLNHFGRRWPLAIAMMCGGVACACSMFVPAGKSVVYLPYTFSASACIILEKKIGAEI